MTSIGVGLSTTVRGWPRLPVTTISLAGSSTWAAVGAVGSCASLTCACWNAPASATGRSAAVRTGCGTTADAGSDSAMTPPPLRLMRRPVPDSRRPKAASVDIRPFTPALRSPATLS